MDYSELVSSIGSWLNRGDLETRAPDFIRLAEARFSRVLRTRDMLCRSSGVMAAQYTTLPAGFREMKNVQINDSIPYNVELVTPAFADRQRTKYRNKTGKPKYLVVLGDTFEAFPTPDQVYTIEMIWYKGIPALSESAPTNWLLEKHPDVYLFGALVEAEPYLRHDERVVMWKTRLDEGLTEIQMESSRSEFSGPLVIRYQGF